jgi:hypothetical protein
MVFRPDRRKRCSRHWKRPNGCMRVTWPDFAIHLSRRGLIGARRSIVRTHRSATSRTHPALAAMDRAEIPLRETALQMAQRHVIEGEKQIERQRRIIAELRADSRSTVEAEKLLETMVQTQAAHERSFARLTAQHEQA